MNAELCTPYYLIDERRLRHNMEIIARLRRLAGVKVVLALKCFAAWSVFDVMKPYLDGVTTSSPYEVRLGYEKFGKEVHSYAVAYSRADIAAVAERADKIIFNSVSQLRRFAPLLAGRTLGLRVNPGLSYSQFDLADPARKHSRLGVCSLAELRAALPYVSGLMFHFNCENSDGENFCANLSAISDRYAAALGAMQWVSLGGGIYFTQPRYPLRRLGAALQQFSRRFGVQVYLEPGESAARDSTELVTTVLDIVRNGIDIAIVDAATEAHMPDILLYRLSAKVKQARSAGAYTYMIAGRTCLAGDVFGVYAFNRRLRVGSRVVFRDVGGYTMVKKNWFNGVQMPAIVVKRQDGTIDLVRRFDYNDFAAALS